MKRLLLVTILAISCTTMKPAAQTGFLNRTIISEGREYRYVVYVPREFNASRKWPVLLALHGGGERGSDGIRPSQVGIGNAIRWHSDRFPMIVVMPQVPTDERWLDGPARAAMAAVDATVREFSGDRSRIYLTGMSIGGYGTWALAYENPDVFAAIAPVCGGILPFEKAKSTRQLPATIGSEDPYAMVAARIREIPVWIFHGAKDDLILPTESRKMNEALIAAGADVRYTEFPDANHNAWDPAYGMPELWQWMLAQRR